MLSAINETTNAFTLDTRVNVEEVTSFSDQQGANVDNDSRVANRVPMNAFNDVSLHEFLQRPFQIETFIWNNTQTTGSLLLERTFPHSLVELEAINRKLANFGYLRADLRFSLRINATRVHCGKLLVAFSPNHANVSIGTQQYTMVRACSLPNVQVNATDAESAILQVPFSLPFEYVNLGELGTKQGASINNMGNVMIFVLNELTTGTNAPVTCTLFASFDNVRVAGMTPTSSIPTVPPNGRAPLPPIGTTSFATRILNTAGTYVYPQSGDAEQEEKSSRGVVSGVAEKVANFAAPFSMIPGIGSFASAIATGASAVGGIAKAFGFSKPTDQSSNDFVQHKFPVLASGKGVETAPTLGCFPDNAISPSYDFIATHEDDMQLSRIFSTPGYIGSFAIDDTTSGGQIIHTMNVTPVDCLCNDTTPVSVDFTPLSYAVSAFEYWRGSMRYQFQFVASAFHSTRIRIGWVPPDVVLSSDPNDSVNVVNHVLDINGNTEFNLLVPYLSKVPWKTVPLDGTKTALCTNGQLFVQVVNPLTYFETPVPRISVNVWSSAGPDFQVAFPTNYRLYSPPLAPVEEEEEDLVYPQGGTSLDDIRTSDYQPMIDANFFVDNNLCHGENVSHLKHVLQRSCEVGENLPAGEYRYNPWTSFVGNADNSVDYSFLSWFSRMFRYARGSVGIRLLRISGNGSVLFRNRRLTSGSFKKIDTAASVFQLIGVGAHWVPSDDNYVPEALIPFYSSQYGAVLNEGQIPYITALPGMDFTIGSGEMRVTEFVGDDFVYGFQIGAPRHEVQLERWFYINTS